MSARKTVPWTILHGDDGDAITVPSEDTSIAEAIQELVWEETGERKADGWTPRPLGRPAKATVDA